MTLQEIFSTIAIHLLKQGEKSTGAIGECRYLAPDGCKCAAGCLIPPEDYDPMFEGASIDEKNKPVGKYFLQKFPDELQRELIRELQYMHDVIPIHRWKGFLQIKADFYQLAMPEKAT